MGCEGIEIRSSVVRAVGPREIRTHLAIIIFDIILSDLEIKEAENLNEEGPIISNK